MTTRLATFPKGGVHPRENKEFTRAIPIEPMSYPSRVSLFLKQHVGAPCTLSVPHRADPVVPDDLLFLKGQPGGLFQLLVDKKDRVREGDRVGETGGRLGAALHASVSGTVQGVESTLHFQEGHAPALVIQTDPEAKSFSPVYAPTEWRHLSRQELRERIAAAGIVGLGGAGFPADVKLDVRPTVQLDTLILNGAECEPYITCDHRIMVEFAGEILEGARILMTVLGIAYCAIGVENNKPDAIAALNDAIKGSDPNDGFRIEVKPLED